MVTESRVLGFIGLSRLLVTYIQLTMAILPIFVLITTVRSVAGDREAGVYEYLLSLPVSLAAWFWGKILGPDSVRFYTRRKTVTQRWPAGGVRELAQFAFPSNG